MSLPRPEAAEASDETCYQRRIMTEKPSTTLNGIVDKIIAPSDSSQSEKAQIAIQDSDPLQQEIRIDNTLTTESGAAVRLIKGAAVKVIIKA